jgi:hypothetical protein
MRSVEVGRDDWIRTSDPLTPSQVRYQAAPHPDVRAPRARSLLGPQWGHPLFYALARLPRLEATDFPDPRLPTCLAITRALGRDSSDRLAALAGVGGVRR